MTAGSEALILKITADTGEVAAGLAPMTKALDKLGDEADAAAKDLRELSNTDVKLSVKDQALQRARDRIDELRNDIARDVVLGVDTKAAQREISNLQTAMRRLEDDPPRIEPEVDTSKLDMADELEGIDSLREGAMQLGDAFGNLDGSFSSVANVMRETVPALADANQTLIAMRLRAEAAGGSLGRLGTAASRATGVIAGPWGLAIAAGVGLLASWAANQQDAEDSTLDLTDAIDAQAGAFDAHNRAAIADKITSNELLLNSERFGIKLDTMATAILGNASAMAEMDAAFDKAIDDNPDHIVAIQNTMLAYFDLRREVDRTSGVQSGIRRAIGETSTALGKTAEHLDTQTTLWDQYDDAVGSAQKKLDGIVASLDILNGRFADTREAQSSYEQGLDDLTTAIDENTHTLNLGKAAGRENDKLIRDQAANIEKLMKARLDDRSVSGESTKDILADYKSQREQLIVMADKLGLSGKAAKEYVDRLLATPKKVKTEVEQEGAEEAGREIDHAARDRDTTIDVGVHVNVDKISQDIARGVRNGLSGVGPIGPSGFSAAPPPAPSTVLVSPRLYLDGRPIRAALHGDVSAAVATSVAAAAAPRRVR